MKPRLSGAEIKALKAALRYLSKKKRLSYKAMVKVLDTAKTDPAVRARAKELGFNPDQLGYGLSDTTLNNFATKTNHLPKDDSVVFGLYVWLRTKHPDAWDQVAVQKAHIKVDPFVTGLREIYGRDPIDPAKIDALTGAYALYRPHFLNPEEEVMRCHLQIGIDKNPYGCTLQMRYAIGRESVTVTAKGKIVPHQDRATLILSDGVQGAFLLYVDALTRAGDRNHALTLAGTLIASADNRQSGASPFMAIREAQQVEPGLIQRDHRLPPEVRARLSFGLVDWDPDRLGRTVRKLETKPARPRRAKLLRKHPSDQPEPVATNGTHKPA